MISCAFCAHPITSFALLMDHMDQTHAEITIRRPSKNERKSLIVEIVESRLRPFIL